MISPYEATQLEMIRRWRNPPETTWTKLLSAASWPFEKAGDAVIATPGLGWAIQKVLGGMVDLANDAAQWSVRPDSIYAEYRGHGHSGVVGAADLSRLDLADVDQAIGWLGGKYKTLAMGEGTAAGALGLPGIPADIVALTLLNLRAIGEYATYCGFDTSLPHERLFAMQVLAYASSSTIEQKNITMSQLGKLVKDVAKKRAWKELEKEALVKVLQEIAKQLGVRLTRAKLAQIVPAAGAAIGGGFNVWFTSSVCAAAFHLYRERFLIEKYGELATAPGHADVEP